MKVKPITIALCFAAYSGWAQSVTPTATIQPGGGIDPTLAAPTKRVSINPPAAVAEAFEKKYPGQKDVVWKAEGDGYRVSYTDPRTRLGHEILYDKNGKIVRQENELDNAAYPRQIVAWYTENYPGVKFTVWETEDHKGRRSYYVPRATEFVWFDKDGKYKKRKERK